MKNMFIFLQGTFTMFVVSLVSSSLLRHTSISSRPAPLLVKMGSRSLMIDVEMPQRDEVCILREVINDR
jgi:hypothetical protein